MKEVRITLSDDQVAAIEAEIAAGEARSVSELVELALDAILTPPDMPSPEQMLADAAEVEAELAAGGGSTPATRCSNSSGSPCGSDRPSLEPTVPGPPRPACDAKRGESSRRSSSGSSLAADGASSDAVGQSRSASFGYAEQATILARFEPGKLIGGAPTPRDRTGRAGRERR